MTINLIIYLVVSTIVAESLGKKGKGILPIISTMPKDNHSVMQLYLDGFKNNFFTIFYCKEKFSQKLNKNKLLEAYEYLGSQSIDNILFNQKSATEKVFKLKNIPFRSFEIRNRNENLRRIILLFYIGNDFIRKSLNINPLINPLWN